ncbi:LysR family transcriptional regulator [Ideonella livida]|uniref:LysR family transcriptional regulator n=1 Tax=Ideonella livida TaxID=2707176 RepID=A0A7C9TIE5_9BURK|nr:LysR family transcriptional regulator [Ideonella livida]NDY90384.1 LysR family transcriptional regulator [Ideonella livida]
MNEQSELRPEHLRALVRVVELGSFTQAAAALGWPKTRVSEAVRHLEARLGTRLLHRTTRRVQPTPDGQAFYAQARDLLDEWDAMSTQFQPLDGGLTGRLKVDMPLITARRLVIPRLPEFLAAHPGLELQLDSTDRRVDLVREGYDCVLRIGALGDSSLVARPLGLYPVATVASPAYLARHGTPTHPGELADHRLVHYATVPGMPSTLEWTDPDTGAPGHTDLPGTLTVNNAEAYQAAVRAGLGLAQLPLAGVRSALQDGELVEVMPRWRPPPMPVHLLYPHRRHLPRRVQVFMRWLEEVLGPTLVR